MSMRGSKRPPGPLRPDEAGASKRRKTEEEALWQLRPVSDLKMSSIYNRSATEAPAELFRKDLISAMKLPDSEPLTSHEYWIITDTWKQEWERGVQVPVNPDSLPAPAVQEIPNPLPPNFQQFKLPKNKYIHLARDAFYQSEIHQLSTAAARAEAACKYDLDATDSAWLRILNGERARAGVAAISEEQLERVIQELEVRCWDKIQAIMKSEEGLGIEYDENVICDVCRSPDSEEGNEMVFCDVCNICVHQACYGITTIPSGQWLCRPCGDGTRPTCVLCPNLGGAMKCTPSGHKWAHVSCVLWIPEVSIGCAEKMEPITKISSIPTSRWSLVCVLCRERKGACIQCSVKSCKTAYHVTCAFKHGLEMRAIIEDENADDGVKLRSYCQKHSVNSKKEKSAGSGSEEDEVKKKRRKEMTSEEKSQARALRLREIEGEFDKHVSIKDISTHLLDVDQDAIGYIYSYWKLKRRAGHNRALLPPKADDSDILCHRQEQADLDKMKMFVQLRQDLERVRNLCYMVSRREKLSRSFFRMREQTFHKQVAVLTEETELSAPVIAAVIEANHGPSIYDKLYSHPEATDNSNDFDAMMARIAGLDSEEDSKKDFNGLIRSVKSSANPYKKVYVNGSTRRSGSMFSGMSSEESAPDVGRGSKYRCRTIGSSTEDEEKPSMSHKKKVSPVSKEKPPPKAERKKRVPLSRNVIDSSSEEEVKPILKKGKPPARSQTLRALEREMSVRPSGTDSDELMPMRVSRSIKFPVNIYSDSSDASMPTKVEDFNEERSPNATNDSQQQLPRTKGAMKQFIPMQKSESEDVSVANKRGRKPSNSKEKLEDSDDDAKNKENVTLSKSKESTTELIVPQRQAAKKASENMRSTTKLKEAELSSDTKQPIAVDESKLKPKPTKVKAKEKEMPAKDLIRKKNLFADSSDFDKDDKDSLDFIAYVPQRQAAKKAAAHIKSGLGSKMSNSESNEEASKKKEIDVARKSPKKDFDKQSKTSSRSSSSSSSNSSSSSCSSSSSSEEEDKSASPINCDVKQLSLRQQSLFSPPAPRPSVDLPFLDKVSRPLSSTSASSDSDSAKESRGSDSCSPIPKRARPRRHGSSSVSDESTHKAPDKKLKTSEWRSECRVPSPTAEGEERDRTVDARASSRPRPRSSASCGNLFNKRDTGPRKSLTDESSDPHFQTKPSKETNKSSELPFTQWKTDEALNLKKTDSNELAADQTFDNIRSQKLKTIASDDEDKSPKRKLIKSQKISDKFEKRSNVLERKASTKSIFSPPKDSNDPKQKELKSNKSDYLKSPVTKSKSFSPTNKTSSTDTRMQIKFSGDVSHIATDGSTKSDEPKSWFPHKKTHSTHTLQRSSVEKYEDTDKYINEDKSQDSDSADKMSLKVMAKIQANLNENTMIKSPKTPMDATSNVETMDVVVCNPEHKLRIRSSVMGDLTKNIQDGTENVSDSSTVHPVESYQIAESHRKIVPGVSTAYPKRSIFSPQPTIKDTACNDLFEFGNNILAVDDSVSDEIMKPFSFNSEFLFKEDSKEDRGVQETLNLVEKLRMTLSSKKPVTEDAEQEVVNIQQDDKEPFHHSEDTGKIDVDKDTENSPSPVESFCDADKSQPSVVSVAHSQDSPEDIPQEPSTAEHPTAETSQLNEEENANKWRDIPLPPTEPPGHIESHLNPNYELKPYGGHPQYRHHVARHDVVRHLIERHEREILERERHEMESREIERHEIARHEMERHDIESRETERHEMEIHEMERHEMERHEVERHEMERHEMERREMERREMERREMERHEMQRHEMGRLEMERQRLDRLGMDRHEMDRREMDRREMERREMERCEMERHERDIHIRERNEMEMHEMERREMERHELERRDMEQREMENHDIERHELEKHPATSSHDLQASVENDNFQDNISKQSDDSRSIMEQSMNSNDQDTMMQESIRSQQSYDNNNSLPQSDCATTSSPYREGDRSERKWGESKITQRRSSASSTNSEGSVCSQKLQIKAHLPNRPPGIMQEMEYANMPPYPCPPMDPIPYNSFSSEASPFVTHATVSLFQPGSSTQLPLQSPGAGLYPPNLGIPYSSTSIMPPLSKPFTTMCAAFASTSQNLALSTSSVPSIKPIEQSPHDDMDLSTEKSFSVQASPTPSVDSFNDAGSGRCVISKLSNESNDTICTQSTLESRSSTKPMRSSSRFTGQGKSPGKSPGFSPKRPDSVKSNASKRSSSSKGSRGRGRGRSRTRGAPPAHSHATGNVDYLGNSIHSKLVGTVYELDFDEETANDGVDLKAMRERRRSIDVHDRKSENSFKDSSQSPRVPSPIAQTTKRVTAPIEPKETRPLSPTRETHKSAEGSPNSRASSENAQFPAIVQPVLPGPVDMRRYQPFETPILAREPFNSQLLGTFETVAAHQPLVEIDEDNEKQLHTEIMAMNRESSPTKSHIQEVIEPPIPFTPEIPMPKVSLSDSRNQLKVKIKGPFRDANYCSVQPVVPQPPQPVYEPPPGILGTPSAVASVTSAMLTGTSNLRRMRKKELLRQYWTQDMNMDDPAANSSMCNVPPPIQQPPLNRTIITIPKAVASMTTIPTREDYKAVVDANMEKKKRKTTGERELIDLQVTMNDDLDNSDDFNIPNFSGSLSQPPSRKGRRRTASTKPIKVVPPAPIAPKLKIKIGSNIIQPVPVEEQSSSFQFRPPKKRLAPKEVVPQTLSYEDVRRESMKFRKIMMADFGEGKKEKKHKPKSEKSEKRKKKKGKKSEKMQVVNSKSDSVTKLVIKITRNKEESSGSRVDAGALPPAPTAPPAPPADPFEYDPSAPDPLAIDTPSYSASCAMRKVRTSKVTPIRLKLARSAEGSSYVMKDSAEASGSAAVSADPDASRPPLPVSKHCQVR